MQAGGKKINVSCQMTFSFSLSVNHSACPPLMFLYVRICVRIYFYLRAVSFPTPQVRSPTGSVVICRLFLKLYLFLIFNRPPFSQREERNSEMKGRSVNSLHLKSLNHISIVCRSVERSVDFYQNVLGFIPIRRPRSFDFESAW